MAAQFAVDLLFGLKGDGKLREATDKLKGVDAAAQGLSGRLRDANGRFQATGNAAGRAANGIRKFGDGANLAAGGVKRLEGAMGGLLGSLGASLAIGKMVTDFKDLDQSLRRLGTVGGNVGELDAGLGKLSANLGGVASKAQLAKAGYQALSAGFSDTAGALAIVNAATKAAVGGLADSEQVTEVLTKTLNAYGMKGTQAAAVTDSISKAVELGQVEWSDYTSQLGRVASTAAVAGVGLDEVNSFIAAATKNGATAEVAFTGLSGTLNTLLQPTEESVKAAKALGIEWNLTGVKTKGFSGLMAELAKAMKENPALATQMLGSQEAVRGAFAAAAKGGMDYKASLEAMGAASGKTDQDFQKMKGSLANQLTALSTAFANVGEAVIKAFGSNFLKALTDVTNALNGFANFVKSIPQPVANAASQVVIFVAKMWLMHKAISAAIGLRAGIAGMLAATATGAATAGGAAATATPKVVALSRALGSLLKFSLITIAIDVVISGLGKLAELQARLSSITGKSTGDYLKDIGGKAATKEKLQQELANVRNQAKAFKKEFESVRFPALTGQDEAAKAGLLVARAREAALLSAIAKAESGGTGLEAPVITGNTQGLDKSGGGSRSSAATRLAGPKLPEYIDKEVLRKWLMSQGMGRTSGDFTNAGHRTPNHMLNAMDMGFTGSQFDHNYVQKTIEMERKLRATGAFGNQLFGPDSDPKGHKDHLHVPTPGGKVKMNPALASLMGIAGGGQEGQVELAQNLIELEAERAEKIRESFAAGQQLATEFERELKIRSASTELEKNLLKFKFEAQDRQAEINELMDAGQVQSLTLLNQEQERLQVLEAQVRAFYDQADAAGALSVQMKAQGSGAFRTDIDLDPNKKKGKIQKYMDQLKTDLADTEGMITSLAGTIESEIGSAMSNAITGLIDGTMTAQEAFGQMFKNIGKAFIDMATQMIAKALVMKVLGILGGAFGGGGIGANNYSGAFGGGSSVSFNPGAFGGGMSFFADGGFVSSPTNAIIGEGGANEYVIPENKMGAAMSRYSAGARGDAVLNGADPTGGSMGAAAVAAAAPQITINGGVMQFGGEDFIRKDQLPGIISQASKAGEARTLAKLQNSPGIRRRVGI